MLRSCRCRLARAVPARLRRADRATGSVCCAARRVGILAAPGSPASRSTCFKGVCSASTRSRSRVDRLRRHRSCTCGSAPSRCCSSRRWSLAPALALRVPAVLDRRLAGHPVTDWRALAPPCRSAPPAGRCSRHSTPRYATRALRRGRCVAYASRITAPSSAVPAARADRGRSSSSLIALLLVGALVLAAGGAATTTTRALAGQPRPHRAAAAEPRPDLDRNGRVLAENRPPTSSNSCASRRRDLDATLTRLVRLGAARRRATSAAAPAGAVAAPLRGVPIRLQLTDEEIARFAVHRHEFPGVELATRLTRYYPHGDDRRARARLRRRDQRGGPEPAIDRERLPGTSLIGKLGVERAYETSCTAPTATARSW